jgi:hypothetical protein
MFGKFLYRRIKSKINQINNINQINHKNDSYEIYDMYLARDLSVAGAEELQIRGSDHSFRHQRRGHFGWRWGSTCHCGRRRGPVCWIRARKSAGDVATEKLIDQMLADADALAADEAPLPPEPPAPPAPPVRGG